VHEQGDHLGVDGRISLEGGLFVEPKKQSFIDERVFLGLKAAVERLLDQRRLGTIAQLGKALEPLRDFLRQQDRVALLRAPEGLFLELYWRRS